VIIIDHHDILLRESPPSCLLHREVDNPVRFAVGRVDSDKVVHKVDWAVLVDTGYIHHMFVQLDMEVHSNIDQEAVHNYQAEELHIDLVEGHHIGSKVRHTVYEVDHIDRKEAHHTTAVDNHHRSYPVGMVDSGCSGSNYFERNHCSQLRKWVCCSRSHNPDSAAVDKQESTVDIQQQRMTHRLG
jgi:hypothetical protein